MPSSNWGVDETITSRPQKTINKPGQVNSNNEILCAPAVFIKQFHFSYLSSCTCPHALKLRLYGSKPLVELALAAPLAVVLSFVLAGAIVKIPVVRNII